MTLIYTAAFLQDIPSTSATAAAEVTTPTEALFSCCVDEGRGGAPGMEGGGRRSRRRQIQTIKIRSRPTETAATAAFGPCQRDSFFKVEFDSLTCTRAGCGFPLVTSSFVPSAFIHHWEEKFWWPCSGVVLLKPLFLRLHCGVMWRRESIGLFGREQQNLVR